MGFRRGKRRLENVFVMKEIIHRHKELRTELCMIFIDIENHMTQWIRVGL